MGFVCERLPSRKYFCKELFPQCVNSKAREISYSAMVEDIMKCIELGLFAEGASEEGRFGDKQNLDRNYSVNIAIEYVFREEDIDFLTWPLSVHRKDFASMSHQLQGMSTMSDPNAIIF
jgi:hypothetical protein